MNTVQGPRQSTPDSAAPNIMSEPAAQPSRPPAQPGHISAAQIVFQHWWNTSQCANAEPDSLYEMLELFHDDFVGELERLYKVHRAANLRVMAEAAGGFRALEKRLGIRESTLRGWAAHERG